MADKLMKDLYPSVSAGARPGGGNNNATYNADGTMKVRTTASRPIATGEGKDLGDAGAVLVTGVTLNKSTTTKTVGQTETLTATVAPANATDKTLVWSTSNASRVTVSQAGLITGVAAGTATITVRTNDKAKTATCVVTVS